MRILLVNDDGVMAEGIKAIAKELEKDYELTIIAPETQQSAKSHSITLFEPLIVKEVKLEGIKSKAYSISGTPADCVRVGVEALVPETIDMVISGINMGLNAGMDILYSGTVSAAIEASVYNLPSIALSAEYLNGGCNFDVAAKFGKKILEKVKDQLLKSNLVLNVNIPNREMEEIQGIKTCKIGDVIWDNYILEENQNGEKTVKVIGRKDTVLKEDTDRHCLGKAYVTITPLHYDLTNFKLLEEVNTWL